jgi:hypothetical protein
MEINKCPRCGNISCNTTCPKCVIPQEPLSYNELMGRLDTFNELVAMLERFEYDLRHSYDSRGATRHNAVVALLERARK